MFLVCQFVSGSDGFQACKAYLAKTGWTILGVEFTVLAEKGIHGAWLGVEEVTHGIGRAVETADGGNDSWNCVTTTNPFRRLRKG